MFFCFSSFLVEVGGGGGGVRNFDFLHQLQPASHGLVYNSKNIGDTVGGIILSQIVLQE